MSFRVGTSKPLTGFAADILEDVFLAEGSFTEEALLRTSNSTKVLNGDHALESELTGKIRDASDLVTQAAKFSARVPIWLISSASNPLLIPVAVISNVTGALIMSGGGNGVQTPDTRAGGVESFLSDIKDMLVSTERPLGIMAEKRPVMQAFRLVERLRIVAANMDREVIVALNTNFGFRRLPNLLAALEKVKELTGVGFEPVMDDISGEITGIIEITTKTLPLPVELTGHPDYIAAHSAFLNSLPDDLATPEVKQKALEEVANYATGVTDRALSRRRAITRLNFYAEFFRSLSAGLRWLPFGAERRVQISLELLEMVQKEIGDDRAHSTHVTAKVWKWLFEKMERRQAPSEAESILMGYYRLDKKGLAEVLRPVPPRFRDAFMVFAVDKLADFAILAHLRRRADFAGPALEFGLDALSSAINFMKIADRKNDITEKYIEIGMDAIEGIRGDGVTKEKRMGILAWRVALSYVDPHVLSIEKLKTVLQGIFDLREDEIARITTEEERVKVSTYLRERLMVGRKYYVNISKKAFLVWLKRKIW